MYETSIHEIPQSGRGAEAYESETAEPAFAPETAHGSCIRVPARALGMILDRGHASAAAVHLLCEALRYGPGHALNWKQVGKPLASGGLAISRRAFYDGLGVLTDQQVIERWQAGRVRGGAGGYARQQIKVAGGYEIAIPERLIANHTSKVVAFVAAVLLSPQPRDARDVAWRFALKARCAIKRIVQEAMEGGYISAIRIGGTWIVARPGVDLIGFATGFAAVENGDAENDDAHSKEKESHSYQKEDHRKREETLSRPESLIGGGRSSRDFSRDSQQREDLAEGLRRADLAGALAPYLLTPSGMDGYAALLQKHGPVVHDAVRAKLAELLFKGVEPGKVFDWNYFEGAALDSAKLAWMEANGIRPGDVLGFHRSGAPLK